MLDPRKKLLLSVAAIGLFVKLAEFVIWLHSVFRDYNLIPGLDMETLLKFGEWGTPGNGFIFTPHRALVAACWALGGRIYRVPGIVAVQGVCGIMGAVLCADIALRLFRRDRAVAFVCGIFYLLYGPFFFYEHCVLQEAVALNLILLAFYASLRASGTRRCALAGAALAFSLIGRPTALFFAPVMAAFILRREHGRRGRSAAALLGGGAAVFAATSLVNWIFGGNGRVFFDVLPYSLQFNAERSAAGAASGGYALPPMLSLVFNALCRVPKLMVPYEIPENLNYHFLIRVVPFVKFLPGPALLLPFAAAGMALVLPKFRRAPALVYLPLLTLALPLCVRDPIGRYRLTLVPYFILCAGYWLHMLLCSRRWRSLIPAGAAALFFAVSPLCGKGYLRPSDFMTHALAVKQGRARLGDPRTIVHFSEYRAPDEEVALLWNGWELSGFRDNRIGVYLYLQLAERPAGRRDLALNILRIGLARSPEKDVYRYYLALEAAERGKFADAEKLLGACDPAKLGFLEGKYHYLYGEMLRLRGDAAKAKLELERALQILEPGSEIAAAARRALSGADASATSPRGGGTAPASPAAPSRE